MEINQAFATEPPNRKGSNFSQQSSQSILPPKKEEDEEEDRPNQSLRFTSVSGINSSYLKPSKWIDKKRNFYSLLTMKNRMSKIVEEEETILTKWGLFREQELIDDFKFELHLQHLKEREDEKMGKATKMSAEEY